MYLIENISKIKSLESKIIQQLSEHLSKITNFSHLFIVKGKSVPLQAWSGPEGSRKLRFPDYMTTAQDGGKVVSPTHRPPLLLFSRLYDVSTSSCAHFTIILYSSSSCLCHSSLLPLIPFPPSVL